MLKYRKMLNTFKNSVKFNNIFRINKTGKQYGVTDPVNSICHIKGNRDL